jgi:hypothetical protein
MLPADIIERLSFGDDGSERFWMSDPSMIHFFPVFDLCSLKIKPGEILPA